MKLTWLVSSAPQSARKLFKPNSLGFELVLRLLPRRMMNHNTIVHERANTRPSVLIFQGMFRAMRINPITQIYIFTLFSGAHSGPVCSWRDPDKGSARSQLFSVFWTFCTELPSTRQLRSETTHNYQYVISRRISRAWRWCIFCKRWRWLRRSWRSVQAVFRDFEKELICCSGRGSFQQQSYGPPATVLGMEYLELLFWNTA